MLSSFVGQCFGKSNHAGLRRLAPLVLALLLLVFGATTASARVWTDLEDYAPGSWVTVHGDNGDGAGYLSGETVSVHAVGPDGVYSVDCEATVDASGAWSCQIYLPDLPSSVGTWNYTATGQMSGTLQSGSFTDATKIESLDAGCSVGSDSFVSGTTVCAKATGLPGGGGGSSGKIEWWAPAAGTATRTTTFSGVSGNTTDTYAPSVCGTWTLKVYSPATTFQDDDTFSITGCATNAAPTVAADDQAFSEGASTPYSASWSDPDAGQTHTCTIDFGDGSPVQTGTVSPVQPSTSGTCSASHTYADGPNSYTITVRVNDGTATGSDTASATVANVAPTIALSGASSVNEGAVYTLGLGAITDPGQDTVTAYSIDWGDGTVDTFTGSPTGQTKTHTYTDGPNGYTIVVSLTDEDGTFAGGSKVVTVNNVAPTVSALSGDTIVDESGTTEHTYTYSIADPGADPVSSVSLSCGTGGTFVSELHDDTSGSFKCKFLDGPATPTVSVSATDSDGATGNPTSLGVTVNNVAPTVTLSGANAADEGQTKHYSFTTSDPGADTFSLVSQGCGTYGTLSNAVFNSGTGAGSFDCTFMDGPASSDVSVQVKDTDNENSNVSAVTVAVANVAPTASLSGDDAANEGQTTTYNFTVNDPGQDTYGGTPDCGTDGSLVGGSYSVTGNSGSQSGSFQCAFPDGPANSTVGIQFTDSDSMAGNTATVAVAVANVAPSNIVLTRNPATIDENQSVSLSGSFADPGTLDTHTVVVVWGDGSPSTTISLAKNVLAFGPIYHQYLDDGPYPGNGTASDSHSILVTMTDKDTGTGSNGTSVTVNNVAPAIDSVVGPVDPIAIGSPAATVTIAANFTDPGSKDVHTCKFVWDDGAPDTSVTVAAGIGTCSAVHTYVAAGVNTVAVTVSDDDTGSAASKWEFVVVYDPKAGFVTGGGWLNSPADAYKPNPALTGKATFGFVSKYQKGASVPVGNTEFQFHAASFNFNSTNYQWLVVAGCKAQYKGTGSVNGVAGYNFLLTAYDAQAGAGGSCGGQSVDRFRIKITDSAGVTVYDNVPGPAGASDDIDNVNPQAIGGGSIVIHSK